MAEKDPATAAAEAAAKELVKVAYGDLLQPAAREIGIELHEFVRAIMVAGRGFGYLIRETYEPFVLRALQAIPLERRIPPSPPMLGQILESISYEAEGSTIYKMFEELLCAAMDTNRAKGVHPAFPILLKSLSPEEADLLKRLSEGTITARHFRSIDWSFHPHSIELSSYEQDLESANFYLEHLEGLSLIDSEYEENIGKFEVYRNGHLIPVYYNLSLMGAKLMDACSRPI